MRFKFVLVVAALCAIVTSVLADALGNSTGCSVVFQTVTATVTESASGTTDAIATSLSSIIGSEAGSDPISYDPSSTFIASSYDPGNAGTTSLASPFSTISSLSTMTSVSTTTNFITVYQESTSVALDPSDPASSSATAYYYAEVDGTTSWLNGVRPPFRYDSYVTKTIELTVYPTAAVLAATTTVVQMQLPSPFTITVNSGAGQSFAAASTSTVTSEIIQPITFISTLTLAPTASGTGVAPGPGPSGWNMSSSVAGGMSYGTGTPGGNFTRLPRTTTLSPLYASSSRNFHPGAPQVVTAATVLANGTANATGSRITLGSTFSVGHNLSTLTQIGWTSTLSSASTNATTAESGPSQMSGATPYDPHLSYGATAMSLATAGGGVSPNTVSSGSVQGADTANGTSTVTVPSAVSSSGFGLSSHSPSESIATGSVSATPQSAGNANTAFTGQDVSAGITLQTTSITSAYVPSALSLADPALGTTGSSTGNASASTSASPTSSATGMVGSTSIASSQAATVTVSASVSPVGTVTSYYQSSTLSTIFVGTGTNSLPTPSVCGEHGDFLLTWDDEPTFSPTQPISDPSEAPPVFNPYHHLYFSNGFVYMPPPSDPFPPISQPRLVMFLTNETGPTSSPDAGGEHAGEIGAGDRASESAFWFNAYSAYLGCDNLGPENCTMQVSGYKYKGGQKENLAHQANYTIEGCPKFKDCRLKKVKFSREMVGLSGVQFQAFVRGEKRAFFMDDLALGWSNNTCAAGLLRSKSR